jgi:hypothetical protein
MDCNTIYYVILIIKADVLKMLLGDAHPSFLSYNQAFNASIIMNDFINNFIRLQLY